MNVKYKHGLQGLGMVLLLGVSLTGNAIMRDTSQLAPRQVTFKNNTAQSCQLYENQTSLGSVGPNSSVTKSVVNMPIVVTAGKQISCSDTSWNTDKTSRTCTISVVSTVYKCTCMR